MMAGGTVTEIKSTVGGLAPRKDSRKGYSIT